MSQTAKRPKVVIIGGGFGGLRAAKLLGKKPFQVTLVDRKNHHTFQPLLYQVATAVLSPGEIASPIRRALHRYKNVEVVLGEVVGFDKENNLVRLSDGSEISYDYLIVAAGARHFYFGRDEWEKYAPGLKTIEDALEIRRRVLLAFELAERDAILTGTHEPLIFAVIGGGPTGVELAGAIAGIAREALAKDFKAIDTRAARVLLFEGSPRVLGTFDEILSKKAEEHLRDLGVEVFTDSLVKEVEAGRIKVNEEWIKCSVALWGTGVTASPLGKALGAETDRAGRVIVLPDLTIPGCGNIFVIGDMAFFEDENGVVPGVAPAAMQQAETVVKNILRDRKGEARQTFKYVDKGSMATIGRNKAIAQIGRWHFSGFLAWLMWLFVHLISLIDYRSRISVLSEWVWAYFTRERSARLITGDAEELQEALRFIEARHTLEPVAAKREKVI
jgi:NADH:ubiquinone reductase (H+-translocating)